MYMATRTANINVRVDPELKDQAAEILHELGITESSAITMFYKQIILNKGLPFSLTLPSSILDESRMSTEELNRELDKGYQEYLDGKGRPVEQTFAELRNELKL